MVVEELIERLEMVAPEQFAQDWDNVGLLVGDRQQEVTRIFIALDADDTAIAQAKACGAQLLLVHHPLIFSPLKRVSCDHFIGARVVELLRAGISCYAMHTNFDAVQMGVLAADRIGLLKGTPLADRFVYEDREYGIGVNGVLAAPVTLRGLCGTVKHSFDLQSVRVFGDLDARVERAAICPGSGKSVIGDAMDAGAQVLITGDIDHHSGIDAAAQGLAIIDAGHYGIEHIFISAMEQYLKKTLADEQVEVIAQQRRDPFVVI